MEHLLKKLLGLLEHATELYQSLFAVVQQEKDAVVGLNLQQLNQACKAKDNLLLKLRILEEQREQLMDKLASDFKLFTARDFFNPAIPMGGRTVCRYAT